MGIRYYAYPIPAERTDTALADPRAFIGIDPLGDAWGLVPTGEGTEAMGAKPVPDMLYLDKCWRYLQHLTKPKDGAPRVSHALFEGSVTMTEDHGWIGYVKALSPATVEEVAGDLALLGEAEVDALIGSEVLPFRSDDRHYILQYLDAARSYTTGLAECGYGLAYLIG